MDGLLDMVVQSADFDALTATPEMVLEKKKFIGPDGAISVGTMPDRGSPTISLPLNGTASIPAGKYSGGKVTQNIPAMGGYTIYPTSKEQQIPTKGVYMGGNIIVPPSSPHDAVLADTVPAPALPIGEVVQAPASRECPAVQTGNLFRSTNPYRNRRNPGCEDWLQNRRCRA